MRLPETPNRTGMIRCFKDLLSSASGEGEGEDSVCLGRKRRGRTHNEQKFHVKLLCSDSGNKSFFMFSLLHTIHVPIIVHVPGLIQGCVISFCGKGVHNKEAKNHVHTIVEDFFRDSCGEDVKLHCDAWGEWDTL